MNNTISLSYPWWYVVLCGLLGLVFAGLLYYKDKRFEESGNKYLTYILAIIRGLAVFFIALLLLSPFIKSIKDDIRKPIIIMAEDRSSSVTNLKQFPEFETKWNGVVDRLNEKFDVKQLYFGTTTTTNAQDTFASTNIGQLLKYIDDNFSDQNPSRIILGTDGIINEGADPLYQPFQFTGKLYAVALGDTILRKDAAIANVRHNKIAFLKDQFSVNVDVSANNMMGKTLSLSLEEIGENGVSNLGKVNIPVGTEKYFKTEELPIDAKSPGLRHYRVRLSGVEDTNPKNNSRDFYVEVLDGRQKILILANAPHPDIAALKSSINTNKNYEVSVFMADDPTYKPGDYSLVILHNLPSSNNSIASTLAKIQEKAIPTLFIVGLQTNLLKINEIQSAVNIKAQLSNSEEILPDVNPSFKSFILSEETGRMMKLFPPLIAPFGEYKPSLTAQVFLNQNIKKIKTEYPLMAFEESGHHKQGVIVGEGLWKWRLFDFLQNKNYTAFDEIINKCIQYTTVKDDKRKFRVQAFKNVYRTNEVIQFDGQLYNDNYELVNEPDVKLIIKNTEKGIYEYTMSKTPNAYTFSPGTLPAGAYKYEASVSFNGKTEKVSGNFQVEDLDLESIDLTARFSALRSLTQKYNGDVLSFDALETLADEMLSDESIKPVLYQSTSTKAAIHFKWIFILIMLLLAIEWFLRRYFGSY